MPGDPVDILLMELVDSANRAAGDQFLTLPVGEGGFGEHDEL